MTEATIKNLQALGLNLVPDARAGRKVVSQKSFLPGDVILQADPLVFLLSADQRGKRCSHCLQAYEATSLSRCGRCKSEYYCSTNCQRLAWQLWHKQECQALTSLSKRPPDTILMLARLLWSAAQNTIAFEDVKALTTNRERFPKDRIETFGEVTFLAGKLVGEQIISKYSAAELVNLCCALSCNSYNISDYELRPIGIGLYPTPALINHSCRPNCVAMFDGAKCAIRCIDQINPGDEVTISYIEVGMPTAQRKKELQSNFFFDCTCTRCLDTKLDAELTGRIVFTEESNEDLRVAHEALEKADGATSFEEKKKLLRRAEKRFAKVLSKYNYELFEVRDRLQRLCIDNQDFKSALHYSKLTLEFAEFVYQPNWPLIGLHHYMVAKLYWYLEDTMRALLHIREAYKILRITHSGLPLFNDLKDLHQQIEMTAAHEQNFNRR